MKFKVTKEKVAEALLNQPAVGDEIELEGEPIFELEKIKEIKGWEELRDKAPISIDVEMLNKINEIIRRINGR